MTLMDICTFFGVDASGKSREVLEKHIKRAYRKLVMKHHPDKGGNPEEFRKIQNAYDLFKEHIESFTPPSETRAAAILFFIFRDFVCLHKKFSEAELEALAINVDEVRWLYHFADVAMAAGFLSYGRRFSLLFMDKSITLPRLYRACAINSLPKDGEVFRNIERMFAKEIPWNFHYLRDSL